MHQEDPLLGSIFGIVISVALVCATLIYLNLYRRIKKAKENENKRQLGQDVLLSGRVVSKDQYVSEFSKTPVVASYWSLSMVNGFGGEKTWNEKKSGWNGDLIEIKTSSGQLFKINLTKENFDFYSDSQINKLSHATVKLSDGTTKVSDLFSSKLKPTQEQIDKILEFSKSQNVDPKALIGNRAMKIDEWLIKSGEQFTILGLLKDKDLIEGSKKKQICFFNKDADSVLRSTKNKAMGLGLLSGLIISIYSVLIYFEYFGK